MISTSELRWLNKINMGDTSLVSYFPMYLDRNGCIFEYTNGIEFGCHFDYLIEYPEQYHGYGTLDSSNSNNAIEISNVV